MTKQEQIEEIKKALECCLNPELNCCNDCPYNNNGRLSCLESEMLKDALNLINELEKENELLRSKTMTKQEQIEEIINNRVKQFAEMLKNNCAYSFIFGQKFITEKRIDELLKEYDK